MLESRSSVPFDCRRGRLTLFGRVLRRRPQNPKPRVTADVARYLYILITCCTYLNTFVLSCTYTVIFVLINMHLIKLT